MDEATAKKSTQFAESYREKFMSVFPELVKELTVGDSNREITDGMRHLQEVSLRKVQLNNHDAACNPLQVLEFNVPGGIRSYYHWRTLF